MLAHFVKTTLSLFTAISIASAANSLDVPLPTGDIVLTVTGDIEVTNDDNKLVFDRETLAALGNEEFTTSTIWTEGPHSFVGVPLKVLTDLIGAQEGVLLATAINDYTVEIPLSDAVVDGPIISYLMDGKEMSVRDKGPLWLIYPYDESEDYRTEVIYSRSIWQLDRIEVAK